MEPTKPSRDQGPDIDEQDTDSAGDRTQATVRVTIAGFAATFLLWAPFLSFFPPSAEAWFDIALTAAGAILGILVAAYAAWMLTRKPRTSLILGLLMNTVLVYMLTLNPMTYWNALPTVLAALFLVAVVTETRTQATNPALHRNPR